MQTGITSLHAAHIAAHNADQLLAENDVKRGKGKKGQVKTSAADGKGVRGKSQADPSGALNQGMDRLSNQLSDIDNQKRRLEAKYQQTTGGAAQGQQGIALEDGQLVHDAEAFKKDCDDFFGALEKDYGELGGANMDGASAIAEINDLMFKLAKMFQELRNIVQDAKTKFDKLSWDVRIAAVNQKKESIQETLKSAEISGGISIGAGVISSGLSFTGVIPKVGAGEALAIAGQSVSKVAEGSGNIASAHVTADAENTKVLAGVVEQSSEQYAKDVSDAYSRATKTSSDMVSLLTELVNLHRALLSALSRS